MLQLSICIPTYNRRMYLGETLQRCIAEIEDGNFQSVVEILVGDNASNDGTNDFCRALTDIHPFLKYIQNEENIGAEGNWLNLIGLAKGNYVWILSDDDDFLSGLIADIVRITQTDEYSLITLNYTYFKSEDEKVTYGSACKLTTDVAGNGWRSCFQKTNFINSFVSSNIFNRKDFLERLPFFVSYKTNPWFQLYVSKNIVGENGRYYYFSAPKLKMRALPHTTTRRNAYLAGYRHFYFDAHVAFVDFVAHLDWTPNDDVKKQINGLYHQILYEKTTWHELSGSNDYVYWVTTLKKLISFGYYSSSLTFWCRDVLLMLLPNIFSVAIYELHSKNLARLGDWLRACEGDQRLVRTILFAFYAKYKRLN